MKKQKALADAAAAERKRIDAERVRKQKADKAAKAAAVKQAAADKKAKQAAERQRRIDNEKIQKQKELTAKNEAKQQQLEKQLAKQLASAETEKARLLALAAQKEAQENKDRAAAQREQAKPAPVARAERISTPIQIGDVSPIGQGEETSEPIATFPLPNDMISNRDRAIRQNLVPICQAIIDNDASVVIHAETKSDYRWLTVRLTLCTRRLDSAFRLRHSYTENTASEPFISLHPGRNSALLGDI